MTLQYSTTPNSPTWANGGHRRHEATKWTIRPGAEDFVLGDSAPDWCHLDEDKSATLVKEGDRRRVWRVRVAGAEIYAKVLCNNSGVRRLQSFLGFSPAKREWEACCELERLGVPAVRALAYCDGVCDDQTAGPGSSSASIFLSEGIPGADPLDRQWTPLCADSFSTTLRARRRRFIDAVAQLFAGAHARGFAHRDGHAGNILVRSLPDDVFDVRFIDVVGSRFAGRPLSRKRRAVSLAQLDQYMQRVATQTDRRRFLKTYDVAFECESRSGSCDPVPRIGEREGLKVLAEVKKQHALRLINRRDRRLRNNGNFFATIDIGGGWKATVCLQIERRHLFGDEHVSDRTTAQWRSILTALLGNLAHSHSTEVVDRENGICLQMHDLSSTIANASLARQAREAFERAHRQRHRDVHAELVLGHAWQRSHGRIVRTALIRPTCID